VSEQPKTIGQELYEELVAAIEAEERAARSKPKPKVEVVAESDVQPKEVRVGMARPVGDVLKKLDPEMPEGARFANAVRIDTEGLYWAATERAFAPKQSVLVRFDYNPWTRADDEIPSCHRDKRGNK
jgi:hypothetical protein